MDISFVKSDFFPSQNNALNSMSTYQERIILVAENGNKDFKIA
jgi:hypothetical protein